MKKFSVVLMSALLLIIGIIPVFADAVADVRAFFNAYVNAANTYQSNLTTYYDQNAKIIRYVIQKNGSVYPDPLIVNTSTYMTQLKMNAVIAKVRNYKNYYKDIKITKQGNNYKVTANRTPSPSPNDKMAAYFIIGKDSNGKWKIKEEMMQTREEIFISQIKKQKAQNGK